MEASESFPIDDTCDVCHVVNTRVAWRSIPATQDYDGAFMCDICEYFYEIGEWGFVRRPYSNRGHFVDARTNLEILPEDVANMYVMRYQGEEE